MVRISGILTLERRGHAFCRYADDSNIYIKSKAAGERVMASVTRFLKSKLKLRVNREKSAVARPWERKFLGYTMTFHKHPRLKAAPQNVERFQKKVRELVRKGRGCNLGFWIKKKLTPIIRGWGIYFRLAEIRQTLEELESAYNGQGPWWNAGASHMNEAFPKRFFDDLGLVSLLDLIRRFRCQS